MGQKWLLWACMGEKSFTMAPNTSRRGDLSFKLLVLTCPVRDKIRPASVGCAVSVNIFAQHAEKGPKSAFLGVLGEFCTGHAAAGVVWGEFCTGRAARELRRASFVPMGTWGRGAGGPCELPAAPNEAAIRSTSHADLSAAVVRGVSGRCSVISHAIPFKFHASLFQSVTTCHLCCGIACDLREGLGLRGRAVS